MTYHPQWQGAFAKYAYKFAASQHWRVRLVVTDLDDCVQECAETWCKLCKVYDGVVDNDRWMMSIYKQALAHKFTDLARQNTRIAAGMNALEDTGPMSEEPLYLYADASRELRMVLRAIAVAPRELLALLLPVKQTRYTPSIEMRISRSWCRLAQVGCVREDLVTELRGLLA